MFTLELLQALSDWQQGGNAKQKNERGKKLRDASAHLPVAFRETKVTCFRRLALHKSAVWKVGTEYQLAETISAWTENEAVAMDFKGGVPAAGTQGVIFAIKPGTGNVILNINALCKEPAFAEAVEAQKANIKGYEQGHGKYGNKQNEVVIETATIPLDTVHAWGGFTSTENDLATMYFGKAPSAAELEEFRKLMTKCGHKVGPYWLRTPEAVARVSEKLTAYGEELKKAKEAAGG
ncbi:MAG: hypothetical protein K8U57_07855 [Planctomycetes bacterium]|nr:hypothetical protein [Planctomycetota bacterium]